MLVKLKNGNSFCGSLVEWRPKEGWFSVTDDANITNGEPLVIQLKDIVEAYEFRHRERDTIKFGLEDVDILERAKKHGWEDK